MVSIFKTLLLLCFPSPKNPKCPTIAKTSQILQPPPHTHTKTNQPTATLHYITDIQRAKTRALCLPKKRQQRRKPEMGISCQAAKERESTLRKKINPRTRIALTAEICFWIQWSWIDCQGRKLGASGFSCRSVVGETHNQGGRSDGETVGLRFFRQGGGWKDQSEFKKARFTDEILWR